MTPAVQKNLIGGGALLVFGALYALYALVELPIGSFSNMGPGMFPLLVGAILALTGVAIALPAALQATGGQLKNEPAGQWETVEIRPLIIVLAAMAAFTVLLEPLGLAPSIFALVGISAFASSKLGVVHVLLISSALIIISWLIFIVGLKMPLDLLNWPL